MYALGIIKEGFGNKLFFLVNHIRQFLNLRKENPEIDKLYIVQQESRHDTGAEEESFLYIFPNLNKTEWLQFISWKEFDSLLKDGTLLKNNFEFYREDFIDFKPLLKKLLVMHPRYRSLTKKYDTKNGIALHVRLGDKFSINFRELIRGQPEKFLLMSPRYYIEETKRLLAEKEGPVYIFSDNPEFAECLLEPELPNAILVQEGVAETFYLFRKFHRAVIGDSTLTQAAAYLNFENPIFVSPSYRLKVSNGSIVQSKYVDSEHFQLEDDTSFKLQPRQYKMIHKTCYSRKT